MVIAHLDGDGFSPALSNLAYVTASENEGHKRVHGRNTKFRGSDTPTAALTVEQVREMRALRDRFGEKLPYWQLGKMFDVGMRAALNVCTGRTYRDVT